MLEVGFLRVLLSPVESVEGFYRQFCSTSQSFTLNAGVVTLIEINGLGCFFGSDDDWGGVFLLGRRVPFRDSVAVEFCHRRIDGDVCNVCRFFFSWYDKERRSFGCLLPGIVGCGSELL